MPNELAPSSQPAELVVHEETLDDALVRMWLHGRPKTTIEGYGIEIDKLRRFVSKPLNAVTLDDLQRFASSLEASGLQPASARRTLAAIKSLFKFGHELGALPFDTAKPLRLPKLADTLADRIISEVEVQRMLAATRQPRNHVLLLLLYASGCRVSEICGLKWKSVAPRTEGGQISVTGKGNRSRSILLPASVFEQLMSIKSDASDEDPVFRSKKRGHLSPTQVLRIVRQAARAAGIERKILPHGFRHSHASHSLDRNCPLPLVMATLGHASVTSTARYTHARPNDSSARFLPL